MRKRCALCRLFAVVVATVGMAWAGEEKSSPQLRIEVNLADGSRVIGTPTIESVPVQTVYAKMSIPLKQMVTIKMDNNHETAAIDLQNGDKLKGVVTFEPINLETVFGKVSVGVEHIKEIRVMLGGGPLAEGAYDGLVLHYSFDRDEGAKVADQSGQGSDGYWVGDPMYGPGVKGKAARFRSKDTYIVSSSPRLNMNGWKEATVSVWVRIEEHTTYGHVINRGPLSTDQPGAFELAVGQVYGNGNLGFRRSPTQSVVEYKSVEANLSLHRWHHLAMTYDGTALRYYIDGQLERYVPASERNVPIWDGRDTKLVIGSLSRLPYIDWGDMFLNGLVDEVYIFNRALRGDEVKQIWDAQKPEK